MMSTAEALSVSGEELPGVICHSSCGKRDASASVRKEGASRARRSTVVPGLMVSSALTLPLPGVGTGISSPSKAPAAAASAARWWDVAAKSSSSARERPQRLATSSAATPWLTSPSGYRALSSSPLGEAPPAFEPIGTRLIDSTPQAITMSYAPAITP